jgi:hypothetical protein
MSDTVTKTVTVVLKTRDEGSGKPFEQFAQRASVAAVAAARAG